MRSWRGLAARSSPKGSAAGSAKRSGSSATSGSPPVLWSGAERALVATLALAMVLWLGVRARRRLHALLERRYRQRIHDFQVRSIPLVRAEQLWRLGKRILTMVAVLARRHGALFLPRVRAGPLPLDPRPRLRPHGHAAATGVDAGPGRTALRPEHHLPGRAGHRDPMAPRLHPRHLPPARRRLPVPRPGSSRNGRSRPSGSSACSSSASPWSWPTPTSRDRDGGVQGPLVMFIGIVFSMGSSSVIGNLIAGYRWPFAARFGSATGSGSASRGRGDRDRLLVTTCVRSAKNEEIIIPNSHDSRWRRHQLQLAGPRRRTHPAHRPSASDTRRRGGRWRPCSRQRPIGRPGC